MAEIAEKGLAGPVLTIVMLITLLRGDRDDVEPFKRFLPISGVGMATPCLQDAVLCHDCGHIREAVSAIDLRLGLKDRIDLLFHVFSHTRPPSSWLVGDTAQ